MADRNNSRRDIAAKNRLNSMFGMMDTESAHSVVVNNIERKRIQDMINKIGYIDTDIIAQLKKKYERS